MEGSFSGANYSRRREWAGEGEQMNPFGSISAPLSPLTWLSIRLCHHFAERSRQQTETSKAKTKIKFFICWQERRRNLEKKKQNKTYWYTQRESFINWMLSCWLCVFWCFSLPPLGSSTLCKEHAHYVRCTFSKTHSIKLKANLAVSPWFVFSEKYRLPFYFDWRQHWTNTVSYSFKLLFSRETEELKGRCATSLNRIKRQSTLIVRWLQKQWLEDICIAMTSNQTRPFFFNPKKIALHIKKKNTVSSGFLWRPVSCAHTMVNCEPLIWST